MRVLLTGATGFLGSRTAAYLAAQPAVRHVLATGRTLKRAHPLTHDKVEVRLGDLGDEGFVESLFVGPLDAVVNCASLSSPWGPYEAFRRANVLTQRHLIAAATAAGVRRFVYVSSPSVYAMRDGRLGIREDESLPRRFANAYARTKAEAEGLLRASTLDYVTVRPRAFVGAGDTVIMPRLLRAHAEGRLRVIGDGRNVVDLTPVRSVAHALWCALSPTLPAAALRQTYNITNGAPVPLWPAINRVVGQLGLPPVTKRLPRAAAKALATVAEVVARLRPGQPEPALTRYGVRVLSDAVTLDISKARRLLGYAPIQSLDDALDAYVRWHRDAHHEITSR